MRLLMVEDSKRLRALLAETIRDAGYSLDLAATASEFRSVASRLAYDLFIVDLSLPDGDGLEIIKELRASGVPTPILVITARAAVGDRVKGLDCGADDYLVKPFNHAELLARVRAVLRRPLQSTGPQFKIGRLTLREASGDVLCDEITLNLRPSERRLLAILIRSSGEVVSKTAIEQTLSEVGREISSNAVEVLVSRLRKTLRNADCGASVVTVHGTGYILQETK